MTKAIDKPSPPLPAYHVARSPKQLLARLSEQDGVKTYDKGTVPDIGARTEDAQFTLEVGEREFRVHCGPPVARGLSGTGMLRTLYLVGRLDPTDQGTALTLRFVSQRPRWAWQRAVGLLAVASLGLFWVLAGPGILAEKALLYGLMLLVVTPVLVHDLRRDDHLDDQRKALLNLLEHTLGPLQLDALPNEPYRKPLREGEDEDDEDEDD